MSLEHSRTSTNKRVLEIDDIDHQNAPLFVDLNMIEFAKVSDDSVAHVGKETVAEIDFATDEAKRWFLSLMKRQ